MPNLPKRILLAATLSVFAILLVSSLLFSGRVQAACANPSPLLSGYTAPCPVFSLSSTTVAQNGSLTLTATPQAGIDYVYTTAYIYDGTTWKPYTLAGNNAYPNYSSAQASVTLNTTQLSSLPTGTRYAVGWDWLWDATSQCYKGPGLNQCNTGQWRLQTFTLTAPSPTPTPTPTPTPSPTPTPTPTPSPGGQPWSGIVAPSRAIDWSKAGVEGGIPSATWTQCGSTISAYNGSASTINTAIQNCTANHYVQLGAGTFNLSTGITFANKDNIAVRGMGANQTLLVFTGTDSCSGAFATVCFEGGGGNDYFSAAKMQPGGSNAASWTAGFTQGATQITLSSIGSAGIQVGQYIYLDQDDDTASNNNLFTCENSSASPACSDEGGVQDPGRLISGNTHQQIQIVKVTGCNPSCTNGATFTITPGLYAPNWSGTKHPGAWWPDTTAQFDGIENLSIDGTNSGGNTNLTLFNAINSWVKGVRLIRTCQCNRSLIQMDPAIHVTIQDNYIYGTSGKSQNYGIESFISQDDLIVNNIFQHTVSPILVHANQGSVYAYNYAINNTYDDGGLPQYHYMASAIGGHSGGVMYNLFEGNITPGLDADIIHGNQTMNTVFRNYFLGSDPGRIDATVALTLYAFNRYWNIVGNVLGTPGYTTTYSGASSQGVYQIGIGGNIVPSDSLVAASTMRWGNYDVVNAAVRFVAGENGSTANVYPALNNPSQTFPASFYYPSRPTWWPSAKAWPPIGPDVAGGNIANLAGHAYTIPAQDCYRNVMGGPVDGGGNVLNFNANTCYP
jgi:hypothetical protein